DRREARLPLPARVAHAAETRPCDPSGSNGRSPVTWGLAVMPAPFCVWRACLFEHGHSPAKAEDQVAQVTVTQRSAPNSMRRSWVPALARDPHAGIRQACLRW